MPQNITVNGDKIRHLRKVQGFTSAAKFAEAIGLKAAQHVYNIEQGKTNPSLGLLHQIAKVLNVPVSDLLTESKPDEFRSAELIRDYAVSSQPDDNSIRGRIIHWIKENPSGLSVLQKLFSINLELGEIVEEAYEIFRSKIDMNEDEVFVTFKSNDPDRGPISIALPKNNVKPVVILLVAGFVS